MVKHVVSASPWSMASLRLALPSVPSPRVGSLRFLANSFVPFVITALVQPRRSEVPAVFFRAFAPVTPLLSTASENDSFEQGFSYINNGSKFYAMRHGKCVLRLNRSPDQQKALPHCLTRQLLKHAGTNC